MVTTEQQSTKSETMRTLESWFEIIDVSPVENLWNSPEPTIHVRCERVTWTLNEHSQSPGPISQNGIIKIDYIPENFYLIPATLTRFLANFEEIKLRSSSSLLKIVFNALRARLGEISLTASLEFEDSMGNIEILTLSSGDFPQVKEVDME